jgi:hypothetical protein
MAKNAKDGNKFKRVGPRQSDPKVTKDLGPGHVTRPDPAPQPKRTKSDAEKEE